MRVVVGVGVAGDGVTVLVIDGVGVFVGVLVGVGVTVGVLVGVGEYANPTIGIVLLLICIHGVDNGLIVSEAILNSTELSNFIDV